MGSPSPQTSVLLLAGLSVLFAVVWVNDQPQPPVSEAGRKQPTSPPPGAVLNRPPEVPRNRKSVSAVQNQQSIPEPDRTMSFPEWVSVVSDTIVALAAVFAGVVAVLGLRTWRHQLRGNAEYELARRLLRALYRVRDTASACRSSLIMPGEFVGALRDAGVPDEEIEERVEEPEAEEAVYQSRWAKVAAALSDLKVEMTEYEVVKGPEIHERAEPLHDCIRRLHINLARYLGVKKGDERISDDDWIEVKRVIWEGYDEFRQNVLKDGESFTLQWQRAVSEIEELVKPMLRL